MTQQLLSRVHTPEDVKKIQRQWVGLTDDEVYKTLRVYEQDYNWTSFAKAIEAKLKQKNGFAEEKNAICSPFMISELWKLHK